jgi:hypothetical protein
VLRCNWSTSCHQSYFTLQALLSSKLNYQMKLKAQKVDRKDRRLKLAAAHSKNGAGKGCVVG